MIRAIVSFLLICGFIWLAISTDGFDHPPMKKLRLIDCPEQERYCG